MIKKEKLLTLVFIILYVIYWFFLMLGVFKDQEANKGMIVIYLLLFAPLTIGIIFKFYVFSLFVLILYESAQLITGIFYVAQSIININDASILYMLSAFIFSLLSLSIIVSSIKYLANNKNNLKIEVLILSIIYVVFTIVAFIIEKAYSIIDICDFITNISIAIIFALYIVLFPSQEIEIFKDEN